MSVDRKGRHHNNFYKKSMENAITTLVGTNKKHNGIQLAPIQQTRENFGVAPGTANTTGNPNTRNLYRNQHADF